MLEPQETHRDAQPYDSLPVPMEEAQLKGAFLDVENMAHNVFDLRSSNPNVVLEAQ